MTSDWRVTIPVDPQARDYVVTMVDFGHGTEGDRTFAMFVRAYSDEEAVRQVQNRCGVHRGYANHLALPRDPKIDVHKSLRLNELTPIADGTKL